MALAHVHHIKYATFVFHRNPCFKSGCEPQQRALTAPNHPKPSCLFKCARVNQFLNQCAPALLISFPHTHHFSIFSSYHSPTFLISSYHSQYQPHIISTTPTFLKIILINHALSNLHWAKGWLISGWLEKYWYFQLQKLWFGDPHWIFC